MFDFDPEKIDGILCTAAYDDHVRAACQLGVTNPAATYVFMERYAHINGFAGSGVALLAGKIGYQRELFRDPKGGSNADRGDKIAAKVFVATIDEHGGARGAAPHRTMARGCVEKVAEYAGLDQAARVRLDVKSPAFLAVVERFKKNYAAGGGTLPEIVRSIGYHIASEYLADREYRIIDEVVHVKNPDPRFAQVVRRARSADGQWGGVWAWVTCHAHYADAANDNGYGVEHDHFEAAAHGARLLEKFPPATIAPEQIKDLLIDGLTSFRADFLEAMRLIKDDIDNLTCRGARGACAANDDAAPAAGEGFSAVA